MYSKTGVLVDRREMLKVKVKSLAEETRIIRMEEDRALGNRHEKTAPCTLYEELHRHRVIDVRGEARATYLAYGLIKGRTVGQIEVHKPDSVPTTFYEKAQADALWKKVRVMIEKYGPTDASGKAEVLARCKV